MIFGLILLGVILFLAILWIEREQMKDDAVLYPRPPTGNVIVMKPRENRVQKTR